MQLSEVQGEYSMDMEPKITNAEQRYLQALQRAVLTDDLANVCLAFGPLMNRSTWFPKPQESFSQCYARIQRELSND